MITFNLNTQENLELLLYPDNQPHVTLTEYSVQENIVVCSLTDSLKVLQLQMLSNVLDRYQLPKHKLFIPYLMAARYDRVMDPLQMESFDLEVIADIINSLNFDMVYLLDPHSDVAPALIKNSKVDSNLFLLNDYNKDNAVLIVPDAGATKKSHQYTDYSDNLTDVVQCLKKRDIHTGEIKGIEVIEPAQCSERNCVIIDDICDGGRTFIEIAKKINDHNPKSLTLIVTHGLFTKGLKELEQYFDEIITSNSLFRSYDSNKVKVIDYAI